MSHKSSPFWRIASALFLLALIVLPSIQVAAQSTWTQDAYVFDSTGKLSADFIARFNAKVKEEGYPVYLAVVDESLLGEGFYAWDAAKRDLYDTGKISGSFVMIVIAPFVGKDSPVYKFGITEMMQGGVYSPLAERTISGHSEKAGPEVAAWIDNEIQNGSWEKAAIDGIHEVAAACQALSLGSSPSSQPAQQAPAPTSSESKVFVVEKNPIDYSRVFLTLIGAIVGMLVLVFGGMAFYTANQASRKIKDARHRAVQSQTAAVNLMTRFEEAVEDALERIQFLDLKVAPALTAQLRAQLTTLKGDVSGPLTSFQSVGERLEQPGAEASEDVYDEIRRQLEAQIVIPMRRAMESLNQIVAEIEGLETQVETAPQGVESARQKIEQAEQAILALETNGMKVPNLRRELAEAQGLFVRAQKSLVALDLPLAVSLAEKCLAEAVQALELAQNFKNWVKGLFADHAEITARLEPVGKLVAGSRETLEALSHSFVASSWKELKDNPTRAQRNIERAVKLLATATQALETQDWEQADQAIDEATLSLQESEMLCHSISARQEELEKAVKQVQKLVADVTQALASVKAYVGQHDADIPERAEERLEVAERRAAQLTEDLGAEMPDYLAITKLLAAVLKEAGEILANSKDDVEKMSQAENIAESEIADATRAVKRADSYEDDHRRDIDSDARELQDASEALLAAANLAYRKASQLGDGQEERRLELYQEAAKYAAEAETKAKKALEMAEADYEREEEKRTPVVVYVPTYQTPSTSSRRDSTPTSTYRPSSTPSVSRSTPSSYTPTRSSSSSSFTRSSSVSVTRSTPSRPSPTRSTPTRGR